MNSANLNMYFETSEVVRTTAISLIEQRSAAAVLGTSDLTRLQFLKDAEHQLSHALKNVSAMIAQMEPEIVDGAA